MKKLIVGVAAALSLVSANAAADGPYRRPPPTIAAAEPLPVPSWSGFYIGAGIGAGAVVHEVSINDVDLGRLFAFDGVGGEGIFGTAIVGWDWQIGATVFGIFADFDFSDISTTATATDVFRASLDHDHSWSVGARLGWLSSPSTLWYVLGGYTEAEFDASISFNGTRVSDNLPNFSGYFVGAGIDTRLAASNWFLRLEYRFTEFHSESFDLDAFTTLDVEPSMHTARLTLTYKFGGYGSNWGGWGK
jgi:outer membrane immunogenic protein